MCDQNIIFSSFFNHEDRDEYLDVYLVAITLRISISDLCLRRVLRLLRLRVYLLASH